MHAATTLIDVHSIGLSGADRQICSQSIGGVGTAPACITATPAEANPAVIAASRNSPEARVSRPTNAVGWSKRPKLPKTLAAARPRFTTEPGVSGSTFAAPRMPSVPKSLFDTRAKLAGRRLKRNTKTRIQNLEERLPMTTNPQPVTCNPQPYPPSGFSVGTPFIRSG